MLENGTKVDVVCVVGDGIWPWLASFCAEWVLLKVNLEKSAQWSFIRLILSFVRYLRRN